MPGDTPSTWSAAVLTANRNGRSPTRSRVGSSTAAVSGSSDGRSSTPPAGALTKPWFEMIVPSTTSSLMRTTKTIVAEYCAPVAAATGMSPGVPAPGVVIAIPLTSGDRPPGASATAAPFNVVLPGTYVVFAGTASRNIASVDSEVPVLRTVIV